MTEHDLSRVTTRELLSRPAEVLRFHGMEAAALIAQRMFAEMRPLTDAEICAMETCECVQIHAALIVVLNGIGMFRSELTKVDVPTVEKIALETIAAIVHVEVDLAQLAAQAAQCPPPTIH